jgi:hypothetical protein
MAAMANPLSSPVMPRATAGAAGRGAGAGAAGLAVVAGAAFAGAGVAAATATAAAGAPAAAGAAALGAAGAAAAAAVGAGAPGAKVGNLIVGADVGLGGKLMRTVSFLGWTFEASAGLGGTAPPSGEMLSAIIVSCC